MCTTGMPGTHRGQKVALDPLELEIQVDGCEPSSGGSNEPGSSGRAATALHLGITSPACYGIPKAAEAQNVPGLC